MSTIISWNVNGIRAAEKKDFIPWLNSCEADVICIQETKAKPEQLSQDLLNPTNKNGAPLYYAYWASADKAGYSGTAIYSKQKPNDIQIMNNPAFDSEGRVLSAVYENTVVISAYFPNSQAEGKRLQYKIDFCKSITDYCNDFVKNGKNIVLCGDYNIAHTEIDLKNPKSNEHNPGYTPEERECMTNFLGSGYIDTFRHFCKEPDHYTWWSYRFHARDKNIGWRIDYQCVNKDFLPQVKNSTILNTVMGSDHCPIRLDLKENL